MQGVIFLIFWYSSKHYYRRCNEFLAHYYSGFLIVVLEMKSGMKPIFYGAPEFFKPTKKIDNALFMSNHTSYADWVVLYSSAFRHGASDCVRFFLKDLARYLPGIGWACYMHEFFLVKKQQTQGNWSRDGQVILDRYASFKALRNRIWVTIFPEGTFHDGAIPDLVEKTQKFASEHNLPVLDYLLTPRTRGFISCVQGLDGLTTHLIDQTVAFTGNADPDSERQFMSAKPLSDVSRVLPDAVDLSAFRGPKHVHIHVRITNINELPMDEEELKTWLHTRWSEKELLLKHFDQHGAFPGESHRHDLTMFGPDLMAQYIAFWVFWAGLIIGLFVHLPGWALVYGVGSIGFFALVGILVQHFYKDK